MRYALVTACLCAFCSLAYLAPLSAQAEMYSYVDANGVHHYTNAPGDKRYKLTTSPAPARRNYASLSSSRLRNSRLKNSRLNDRPYQQFRPSGKMSNEDRLLHTIASRSSSARPKTKAARRMYDLFFYDGASSSSPMRNYGFFDYGRNYSYTYTYSATPADIEQHIQHAARLHRLDPHLIKAVIKTESNFNPMALSPKGAQGLMQLMPGTARDMNVMNPFDARQNIFGGARYLRQMLNQFGDISLALAGYNAGPNRVASSWSIPNIPETQAYVSKVMRHYRAYRGGAEARAQKAASTATMIRKPAKLTIIAENKATGKAAQTATATSSIKVKNLVTVQ